MLRNKLIPDTEVAEAITLFVSKKEFVNDPVDRQALIDNGYDKELYKKLFVEPNREYYKVWEEINSFSGTYRQYIEFMPLTKEVVEFVCTELAKSYNPYFLAQTLEDLFTKNMVKKQEFKDIAAAEGITLPSNLPSLA